jgi:hypothetical protein
MPDKLKIYEWLERFTGGRMLFLGSHLLDCTICLRVRLIHISGKELGQEQFKSRRKSRVQIPNACGLLRGGSYMQ